MNHNFNPTPPSLTKSKREFIRLVGLQQYVLGTVLIPAKMYSSVEMLFHFLAESGISFSSYVQIISGFGFTLLYDLICEMKIKSYFELLKIMKFIRLSLKSIVESKDMNNPFFKTTMLPALLTDFSRRKMGLRDQERFLQFLLKTSSESQQGICIQDELYAAIWKVWDERNKRG